MDSYLIYVYNCYIGYVPIYVFNDCDLSNPEDIVQVVGEKYSQEKNIKYERSDYKIIQINSNIELFKKIKRHKIRKRRVN